MSLKGIKEICELLFSLPVTAYVNIKCLKFSDAVKLPILVRHGTRLGSLNRNIQFTCKPSRFMVKIGWRGTECRETGRRSYFHLNQDASITFHGWCHFSSGISLVLDTGHMEIGNDVFFNKNCFISCNDSISIGDHVMCGWNIELLDSDNHSIFQNGKPKRSHAPILIGNHVWIASYAHLLKGAKIPSGSVVGYKSVVLSSFEKNNILIAGYPAKELAENVEFQP